MTEIYLLIVARIMHVILVAAQGPRPQGGRGRRDCGERAVLQMRPRSVLLHYRLQNADRQVLRTLLARL